MKKLYTLVILCVSAIFMGEAYAQNTAGVGVLSPDKIYTIADVKVTGSELYDEISVIKGSGLFIGSKIKVPGEQVSSAIRRLWNYNLFDDVEIYVNKVDGDDIYLEIRLVERKPITKIKYVGVNKSLQEDLMKDLSVSPNTKIRIKAITEGCYNGEYSEIYRKNT